MSDTALVLAAFGTSTEARDTYAFFEARARERFPHHDIFWAYTSHTLRGKMAREGLAWQSPEELLRELAGKGYAQAVLQSLHIVPGREFEKVMAAARQAPLPVSVGGPLLACSGDCSAAAGALEGDIADPTGCITVVVGHGSPDEAAQNAYRQFSHCLAVRYPCNVLLAMVEGEPAWDAALHAIRLSGIKKVKFLPLMFVAGDHIANDVLGDTDSWAAQLAGYDLQVATRGLGFNDRVVHLYFEHLQEALKGV